MAFNCKGCQNELSWPVDPRNFYSAYCSACKTCRECHESLDSITLEFWLKHKEFIIAQTENDKPIHPLCLAPELHDAIVNKQVAIKQTHLDILNAAHLCIKVDLELGEDANCAAAEIAAFKWFDQLENIDEKFLTLRRIEALAATFSVLLKKDPRSKTVKTELSEKQKAKYLAAESKQDKHFNKCDKCGQKFDDSTIDKHFKECDGKTPKAAAKVKTRTLNDFEKTMALQVRYGLTPQEAFESTRTLFHAQGKELPYNTINEMPAVDAPESVGK